MAHPAKSSKASAPRSPKGSTRAFLLWIGLGLLLAALGVAAGSLVTSGRDDCSGRTRTYYVAAVDMLWDYAPLGYNGITGGPFDGPALGYVAEDAHRIGDRYWKAAYREYTDATFSEPVRRGPAEEHLGILGPVLRAEVGDTIQVVFRNLASIPATIHPHGVAYDSASEGGGYAGHHGLGVKPGDTAHYTWEVPARAGPSPGDGSSRVWLYHSHSDEPRDIDAGLVGPLVVTSCGMGRGGASPRDVDREFFAYLSVVDENESPYLETNIKDGLFLRDRVDREDPGFIESNLMHSINGFVYGNVPGLHMRTGEHVRWYVLSLGSEVDLHAAHWHGNTLDEDGVTDVTELLPSSMKTLDMVPDSAGDWLFHCHVDDHLDAGMVAMYHVHG